jgi:hypothetical protein
VYLASGGSYWRQSVSLSLEWTSCVTTPWRWTWRTFASSRRRLWLVPSPLGGHTRTLSAHRQGPLRRLGTASSTPLAVPLHLHPLLLPLPPPVVGWWNELALPPLLAASPCRHPLRLPPTVSPPPPVIGWRGFSTSFHRCFFRMPPPLRLPPLTAFSTTSRLQASRLPPNSGGWTRHVWLPPSASFRPCSAKALFAVLRVSGAARYTWCRRRTVRGGLAAITASLTCRQWRIQ